MAKKQSELRSDRIEHPKGVIKTYDLRRGFGFISQGNGEPDVFVTEDVIDEEGVYKRFYAGDEVYYQAVRTPKGLRAIWARLRRGL